MRFNPGTSATPLPVTVSYATTDGTATAGSDYTAATGQLTFAPHAMVKTIVVPILGNFAVEPDEAFTLTLSNPVNAQLGRATATGTMTNDDVPKAKPGHFRGVVNNGGSMELDVSADGSTTRSTVTSSGRFAPDAESASGTFNIHTSFDDASGHYECGTGNVAFFVSLQG